MNNRLSRTDVRTSSHDPSGTDTMGYDNANGLLNLNSTTYAYDLNGNRIQKTETGTNTTYTYDDENRLTRVEITGTPNQIITYAYDPFGRRIEKNVNGTITRYFYDKEAIILGYDQSGTVTARYTHGLGIDEPYAMEKNSAMYYYHADGLGSIVALTNSAGSIAQTYTYDSFGNITSGLPPSVSQPYTYTSREYDPETGLYFYRARYYDPKAGRFLQRDPIGFAGGDVNLYGYVGNHPVNFVDPMGLDAYMCTKPLDALGGAGQLAYENGVPLLYHQYICVKNGQTTVCGGQDRTGGPYSPGKPSKDQFNADRCKKEDDRSCMDKCLTDAIQNPDRPYYGLVGPGTNCQKWANNTYANCVQQCKGQ